MPLFYGEPFFHEALPVVTGMRYACLRGKNRPGRSRPHGTHTLAVYHSFFRNTRVCAAPSEKILQGCPAGPAPKRRGIAARCGRTQRARGFPSGKPAWETTGFLFNKMPAWRGAWRFICFQRRCSGFGAQRLLFHRLRCSGNSWQIVLSFSFTFLLIHASLNVFG